MRFVVLLQTKILSFILRNINANYYDGFSKFKIINKIWNNIKLDSINGDYIEFGILNGKTLHHSYKVSRKLMLNKDRKFWGLDSFEGFPVENHDFYKNMNFQSSFKKTTERFRNYPEVNIVKGFFKDSLSLEKLSSVDQFSFVFVDCDIYESSLEVFPYIKKRISTGSFIMIDDFSSVDRNGNSIAKAFMHEFKINEDVIVFDYFSNGIVFRLI